MCPKSKMPEKKISKNQGVFVKHYGMPLAATKSKNLFLASRSKSRSQGHWPWCQLKGRHLWSMHAKYEVSISNFSKVIAKVKVDNRQIDRLTDRQTGQKQYAPDHSIRGHENVWYGTVSFQITSCYVSIQQHSGSIPRNACVACKT